MKNNKGFTLIELLAAIVILGVIIGIGVVSYQAIIKKVEKNYYETLEQDLLLAGSDYFNNHREEKPFSGYSIVHIDELVGDKYIDPLKDRSGKVCSPNNDSKVYIYKTNDGYDYKACLVCNDYETIGNYCDGNIMGIINISANKADGSEYNVLLSYNNTSWSNSNVTVKFSMEETVTNYVVTNVKNNEKLNCNNINNNSCSMVFSTSGSYTVEAYNETKEVGAKRAFNVRIVKEKPVCTISANPGTYNDSQILTINVVSNGSTINGYSWNGGSFDADNTLTVSEAGTYQAQIRNTDGFTADCSIDLVERTEYKAKTCLNKNRVFGNWYKAQSGLYSTTIDNYSKTFAENNGLTWYHNWHEPYNYWGCGEDARVCWEYEVYYRTVSCGDWTGAEETEWAPASSNYPPSETNLLKVEERKAIAVSE